MVLNDATNDGPVFFRDLLRLLRLKFAPECRHYKSNDHDCQRSQAIPAAAPLQFSPIKEGEE